MLARFFEIKTYGFFSVMGGVDHSKASVLEGFEFAPLSFDDFQNCRMAQEKSRMEWFDQRLKNGHQSYGFRDLKSSEIIGYFWVSAAGETLQTTPMTMGVEIDLQDHQSVIWDCRMHPEYQRRGLYRAGLCALIHICAQKDVWMMSETSNMASRKGIESAGFTRQYICRFARIFGIKFIERRGVVARLGLLFQI